jgi:hypothetical protein
VVQVALAVGDGDACCILTSWLYGGIITAGIRECLDQSVTEVHDEDPGGLAEVGD